MAPLTPTGGGICGGGCLPGEAGNAAVNVSVMPLGVVPLASVLSHVICP
jgi:hypothetical protein